MLLGKAIFLGSWKVNETRVYTRSSPSAGPPSTFAHTALYPWRSSVGFGQWQALVGDVRGRRRKRWRACHSPTRAYMCTHMYIQVPTCAHTPSLTVSLEEAEFLLDSPSYGASPLPFVLQD